MLNIVDYGTLRKAQFTLPNILRCVGDKVLPFADVPDGNGGLSANPRKKGALEMEFESIDAFT